MTKTRLCREAGISIGATGAWDRGIRLPSRRIWEKISPGKSYEEMVQRENRNKYFEAKKLENLTTSSEPVPAHEAPPMVPLEAVTEDVIAKMKPDPEEDAWDTF